MISGFVILRTLKSKRNFKTFLMARFKRIYPSLWISILLIYIICNSLNQAFIAPIPISSLIPSVTLVSPDLINQIFGSKMIWTTGVLWSLWVEIQFYILAGFLYFKFKKLSFITNLLILSSLLQIIKIVLVFEHSEIIRIYNLIIPLNGYLFWFLAGCVFYECKTSISNIRNYLIIFTCFTINIATLSFNGTILDFSLTIFLFILLFYLIFLRISMNLQNMKLLESKFLVMLGGLSYELYLIHESIGVSIISKIYGSSKNRDYFIFQFGLIVVIFTTMLLLAFIIRKISNFLVTKFLKKDKYRLNHEISKELNQ
jgi:peptidoglycan/LPS O-acetylase OafA/YrhL